MLWSHPDGTFMAAYHYNFPVLTLLMYQGKIHQLSFSRKDGIYMIFFLLLLKKYRIELKYYDVMQIVTNEEFCSVFLI